MAGGGRGGGGGAAGGLVELQESAGDWAWRFGIGSAGLVIDFLWHLTAFGGLWIGGLGVGGLGFGLEGGLVVVSIIFRKIKGSYHAISVYGYTDMNGT